MSLNIIPKPAVNRDLIKSSDYSQDLKHDGAKVPSDEYGKIMGGLNFSSNDRETQLIEMQAHLNLSVNKEAKPLQHLVFSYAGGIRPTRQQVVSHLKEYLQILGMPNAFALFDCHENTEHFHVHVLLDRLAKTPDAKGRYKISDSGEFKVTSREKRKNGKVIIRTRTDESICRQVAIARICKTEGWEPPNLTHDHLGKPILRINQKDTHSQPIISGERKSGKKSKQRQLAEVAKQIFDSAAIEHKDTGERFWAIADRMFAEKVIEITIKFFDDGKPGGIITGPDNRKCSFSKCGKKYSARSLIEKYGLPSNNDGACHNEYLLQPFEYKDLLTSEEIKKRLLPIFKNAKSWGSLIDTTTEFGKIKRSGGGLVFIFNNNSDTIKFSKISNKYSLSRLEKLFGQCPLPTTKFEAQEEYQAKLIEELIEQPETQQVRYIPTIPLLSQIKQQQFTKEYHYVAGILGKPEQPKQ
ncbi:relaxase/mobilization nuclease domain-containing protein, partial [Desulfovibrio litoralis]